MKHAIEHGLGKERARKAARRAFESYKERFSSFNPQANWLDEDTVEVSFSAKGATLGGRVELTDQQMLVDMNVPFILKPFRKKAIGVIEEEMQKWVKKAERGELDSSEA